MTFERQTRIGLTHPTAVIDNLDGCATGIDNDYIYMLSSGIHSILYQLLYHGSRPLNDLASCYLVGHRIGEKVDNIQS